MISSVCRRVSFSNKITGFNFGIKSFSSLCCDVSPFFFSFSFPQLLNAYNKQPWLGLEIESQTLPAGGSICFFRRLLINYKANVIRKKENFFFFKKTPGIRTLKCGRAAVNLLIKLVTSNTITERKSLLLWTRLCIFMNLSHKVRGLSRLQHVLVGD